MVICWYNPVAKDKLTTRLAMSVYIICDVLHYILMCSMNFCSYLVSEEISLSGVGLEQPFWPGHCSTFYPNGHYFGRQSLCLAFYKQFTWCGGWPMSNVHPSLCTWCSMHFLSHFPWEKYNWEQSANSWINLLPTFSDPTLDMVATCMQLGTHLCFCLFEKPVPFLFLFSFLFFTPQISDLWTNIDLITNISTVR